MVAAVLAVVCALASHLGLTSAVGRVTGKILGCTKCFTFWISLIYLYATEHSIPTSLVCATAASYLSIWCEVGFVLLNNKYNELWEKVIQRKE